MRLVRPHRRDPDDVVARDKTEQEEDTDEVLGSSRHWWVPSQSRSNGAIPLRQVQRRADECDRAINVLGEQGG